MTSKENLITEAEKHLLNDGKARMDILKTSLLVSIKDPGTHPTKS